MAQNANPNVGKGKSSPKAKGKGSSSSKAAAALTKKGKISTAKPNSKTPMLASSFDEEGSLLKGLDLSGIEPVTIDGVAAEAIGEDEKLKPILSFKEIDKRLVLNKTNRSVLQEALGNDMNRWPGHQVELFPAMVDFRGKTVQAVRLRMPTPKGSGGGGLRRKG